ncbi:hypothetical protein EDC04DRAFT_2572639, partial [Pisolithus marmoratus]
LQCRLYSRSCCRPRQVAMLTRCADADRGSPCFPVAESLLQDAALQPYIHDCQVIVHEGRCMYYYHVFFKCHCRLQTNVLLSSFDSKFQGDAVVMRIGAQTHSVVNMHARDVVITDYIIPQSVTSSSHGFI